MIPGSKNVNNIDKSCNNQGINMTPIDISKIMTLFSKADKPEY
jgi:hypothetical protein